MKLGIVLANGITNICRNGAIAKSPYVSLGGHFTIWPLKAVSDLFRERQFCIVLQRNTFIGTQMIYSGTSVLRPLILRPLDFTYASNGRWRHQYLYFLYVKGEFPKGEFPSLHFSCEKYLPSRSRMHMTLHAALLNIVWWWVM